MYSQNFYIIKLNYETFFFARIYHFPFVSATATTFFNLTRFRLYFLGENERDEKKKTAANCFSIPFCRFKSFAQASFVAKT